MKFKPLGDRVLVHPLEDKETEKGGIILPDSAQEKSQQGKIVALGSGGKDHDGNDITFTVKKNDIVLMPKYGGTELKLDGKDYQILRESDLLGIIG
ncbi:MAG: chaperonin GroES [Kiritimatiellia bacterium]|jgi:chaperonin GroES